METEGCVLVCKQTACVKMREAPRTASENNKLWMNCSYQPCAASHHWRGTSKYHMPNYNQTHHLSQLPQLRLSSHTVVVPRNEIIRVKNTIRNSEISCGCCLTIKRGGYKKKGDAIPAVALHRCIGDGGFHQHTLAWLKCCFFSMEVINKCFRKTHPARFLHRPRRRELHPLPRYQYFTSACPTRSTFLNSRPRWSAYFQQGVGVFKQWFTREAETNVGSTHYSSKLKCHEWVTKQPDGK